MTTILVVDDNACHRDLLSRRLRHRGFEVLVADNGPDAIERTRDGAPDVVLMDVVMAGMDGIETTKAIKSDAATRDIPIIALSAGGVDVDADHCLAAGCVDFQPKPFDFDSLLEKINRHAR